MFRRDVLSLRIAIPAGLIATTLGMTVLMMGIQTIIVGIVAIFIYYDIVPALVACGLGLMLACGGLAGLGVFFSTMGLDQIDDSKIRKMLGIALGIYLWYLIMGETTTNLLVSLGVL